MNHRNISRAIGYIRRKWPAENLALGIGEDNDYEGVEVTRDNFIVTRWSLYDYARIIRDVVIRAENGEKCRVVFRYELKGNRIAGFNTEVM